ncbi:MAG: hypothetical protein JXB23_04035, partial [Candidatus Aminicenantes bacterium]|nr:hypothetical protein [Candidatus Aminicenantes bacterium]
MMKNEVTCYLERAENALRSTGIVKDGDTYEQEYGGRIASFGPSVILSGLLPTVAFYSKDEERGKVMKAIMKTINLDSRENLLQYLAPLINDKAELKKEEER